MLFLLKEVSKNSHSIYFRNQQTIKLSMKTTGDVTKIHLQRR